MSNPWDNDPVVSGPWDNDPPINGPWDNDTAVATADTPADDTDWDAVWAVVKASEDAAAYQRKLDDAMYGQQSLPSRMAQSFKGGVESSLGTVFDLASGGAWEARRDEAYGNTEAERDAMAAEGRARVNAAVARNSSIPGAGLLIDTAEAAGSMAPAMIAGAAAAPANAAKTTYAAMGALFAPEHFKEAKRAGKGNLEAAAYTALQTAWEIGGEVVGGKVAKAFGGRTFEQVFDSQPVKSVLGYVVGTAADSGSEAVTEILQGATNALSGVNENAWQGMGERALRAAAIGGILSASANAVPTVADFIQNPSRNNARKAGIPPEAANSKQQREQIAKTATDLLTADDFKKQIKALSQGDGPITSTQADYLIRLTEARATASGETLGDYVGKRIKGVQRGTWQGSKDALEQADPTLDAKRPSGAIQFLADDGRAVIHAFESANLATMVHELGHLFRRDLLDTDLRTAERWAGVGKSGGKWSRFAEEKFARGFENYLRTGKHPHPKMRQLFQKFRRWMTEVYSTIKGTPLNVSIPDDMRVVYDNLFAPQETQKYGPENRPRDPNAQIPIQSYDPERDPRLPQQTTDAPAEEATPAVTSPIAAEPQTTSEVAEQPAQTLTSTATTEPIAEPPTTGRQSPYEMTSTRHAWTREDREFFGFDEIGGLEEVSFQQDQAQAIAQGIPDRALDIAADVITNPRAMSPVESAGMATRLRFLVNAHKALNVELKDAGDIHDATMRVAQSNRIEAEMDALTRALDYSGSERGRWLNAQKFTIDQNLDLATVVVKAKAAKGGELTAEERKALSDKVDKHERAKKLQEKSAAAEKKKTHREVARLRSAISNLRQKIGLDKQKLGNVDVPGLADEDRAAIADLNKKLKEADDALAAMAKLPQLDAVHNRPSELPVSSLVDAITRVRDIMAAKTKKPKPEPTSAEIENRRIKSLERQLEEVEKQLASPDQVQQFNYDVASKRRTQLKDQLRTAREALSRKQPPPSSLVETRKIVALEKALAEAQSELAKARAGIRIFKEPGADVPSERRDRLSFELKKTRQEVRDAIAALEPKTFWSRVKAANDLALGIAGSIDFSGLGRQAGLMVGHPIIMAKSVPNMLRAARSELAFHKQYEAIRRRDNAKEYDRVGLAIQDMDAPLSEREDFIASKLLSSIPGIRGSQRAYLAVLNQLRADAYDAIKYANGGDSQLSMDQRRDIAHTVNVFTGRGNWKLADPHMRTIGLFVWAPRLFLSRMQFLIGDPYWRADSKTKKIVLKEYARAATGLAVVYGLYALAFGDDEEFDLTFDPRSTEFGKIKLGDTRVDPLAGLAQPVRYLARTLTSQKIDEKGKVKKLTPYDKWNDATRFVRSKLAPGPGTTVNLWTGGNYIGEPVSLTSAEGIRNLAVDTSLPISMRDFHKPIMDQGIVRGIALNIANLFGHGVQTYDSSK